MRDHKRTADGAADNESLPPAAARGRAIATVDSPTAPHEPGIEDDPFDRRVPALVVDDDHRIRAANRPCVDLFAGERLLGRHCYEVFHHRSTACEGGIRRCPLRHYRESGQPCRVVHVHQTRRGAEHHEIIIHPSARDDLRTCLELRPVAIASAAPSSCRLVGRSPAFNRTLELLLRAAMRETPVLLIGEPGTCREMVARRLHQIDGKPNDGFVAVHCAGLQGARFATELAGLMPGASDLAACGQDQPPVPSRGTLYLDDAGDLGLGEQGELVRLLKGAARRQKTGESAGAGLRLVCASRPDLRARVAKGSFLEDLYYRINVFPIPLAPLRERRSDLPLLVECLLRQIGCDPRTRLHSRALEILDQYPFPGNLRELRRILEHASLQAEGRQILPEDLPAECRASH